MIKIEQFFIQHEPTYKNYLLSNYNKSVLGGGGGVGGGGGGGKVW